MCFIVFKVIHKYSSNFFSFSFQTTYRGVKNPEAVERKRKKQEEIEKQAMTTSVSGGGGGGLKVNLGFIFCFKKLNLLLS